MYLSATITNGYHKKTTSRITGLDYLNIKSDTILKLDRNNKDHLRAIEEIKEQLNYTLNNCSFNGFISKIGENHLRECLKYISMDDSDVKIEWDHLNNETT